MTTVNQNIDSTTTTEIAIEAAAIETTEVATTPEVVEATANSNVIVQPEDSPFSSSTVVKGDVWCITKNHPLFEKLLAGWKGNMSTPTSKLIAKRIQWTEITGLLPLLVLGTKIKDNKGTIRFAAHGGSEDIQYLSTDVWFNQEHSKFLTKLTATNNDEVNEWRDFVHQMEEAKIEKAPKTEKVAKGRPSNKKAKLTTFSSSFNNSTLLTLSNSIAASTII